MTPELRAAHDRIQWLERDLATAEASLLLEQETEAYEIVKAERRARDAEAALETTRDALRHARAFIAGVDLHGTHAESADQWRYALLPKIDAALAEAGP